jgi:NAD(P)-dependent dehydrogenase (short-subunit alcohol dehydrogenase family)
MAKTLAGKTALVTGASRGIGRAIACRLAADGAYVICHYGARQAGAEETARLIREGGGEGAVVGGEIREPAAIEAMFGEVDRLLAGRPLDILVNNAGIGGGGAIDELSEAILDDLFDTNVKGTVLVTQKALPRVPQGGRVINVSSMVGLAAYPKSIAYAMTKAALNSFTRSLAVQEGERGVTVNAVAPGATDTDFIAGLLAVPQLASFYAKAAALGRIGQPEDIAAVVAFLASAEAGWITGQVIQASGGMHL